ncbi:MAG: PKD domain-containing protein, partial [Flavobacteriales bacterium]
TGANQLHTFTTGNDFGVSAMVQADNGCYATDYLLYTVHPKPTAVMSASPATGCSPLSVCTDNQTLGNIQSTWNFGEGGDIQSANACHEYINTTASAIDFEIELHVVNEFMCSDSSIQIIYVQPQPVAQFSLSSTESCFPLEQITNTPATTGATNYQWVVNGAAYSNDVDATFSFDTVGTHHIELIAMNDFGCADAHTETYIIHPKPQIAIDALPVSGCAPLDVSFINNTQDGNTYSWTFGDGQHSLIAAPIITFDTEGLYDVQLFATSIHGCENVAFFTDMIEVFGLPLAGFTYTPNDEIIYELDVAFADTSSGAVSYTWDFGDGFNSLEPEPVHHYHHGGVYYVEQTVTNENGCSHSQTQMVNIDNTFYIYIPNSFTPDNDGINDVFAPVVSDVQYIKLYEMVVMNRWGEVIFKSDNPEIGWTGNVRGGEYYAHNDCFTYNIRIEFNNQTVNQQHTGQITMLR